MNTNTQGKIAPDNYAVRVGEDEIGRILVLKHNHDLTEELLRSATRYQKLGWDLALVKGSPLSDVGVDLSLPQESLSKTIREVARRESQLGLAVRTGGATRHMVLEISGEEGFAALAALGDWRAGCVAHAGSNRELHYFKVSPQRQLPLTKEIPGLAVTVYGDGGLAPLPPSQDALSAEPWCWLVAPWEQSPGYPSPALWDILERHHAFLQGPEPAGEPGLPSWDELFRYISTYEDVLQALLAPAASPTEYYQRILRVAWAAGLTHPQILKGLLWHAPHGDAKHRPERWEYLQMLISGAADNAVYRANQPGPAFDWYRLQPDPGMGRFPSAGDASGWEAWPPGAYGAPGAGGHHGQMPRPFREPGPFDLPPGRPGLGRADLRPPGMGQTFPFLDDRITMERSRYEALVFEMGKLSSRAAELEQRLAEYEVLLKAHGLLPGRPGNFVAEMDRAPLMAPEVAAVPPAPEPEPQAGGGPGGPVTEFLQKNPDLAGDPGTPKMLLFCLKNYIDIDPGNSGLSIQEKLVKAGVLVRNFMGKNI